MKWYVTVIIRGPARVRYQGIHLPLREWGRFFEGWSSSVQIVSRALVWSDWRE